MKALVNNRQLPEKKTATNQQGGQEAWSHPALFPTMQITVAKPMLLMTITKHRFVR